MLGSGRLFDTGEGLGKAGVALGTMRKVDAGARIFWSPGLGVIAVCGTGAVRHQLTAF